MTTRTTEGDQGNPVLSSDCSVTLPVCGLSWTRIRPFTTKATLSSVRGLSTRQSAAAVSWNCCSSLAVDSTFHPSFSDGNYARKLLPLYYYFDMCDSLLKSYLHGWTSCLQINLVLGVVWGVLSLWCYHVPALVRDESSFSRLKSEWCSLVRSRPTERWTVAASWTRFMRRRTRSRSLISARPW